MSSSILTPDIFPFPQIAQNFTKFWWEPFPMNYNSHPLNTCSSSIRSLKCWNSWHMIYIAIWWILILIPYFCFDFNQTVQLYFFPDSHFVTSHNSSYSESTGHILNECCFQIFSCKSLIFLGFWSLDSQFVFFCSNNRFYVFQFAKSGSYSNS